MISVSLDAVLAVVVVVADFVYTTADMNAQRLAAIPRKQNSSRNRFLLLFGGGRLTNILAGFLWYSRLTQPCSIQLGRKISQPTIFVGSNCFSVYQNKDLAIPAVGNIVVSAQLSPTQPEQNKVSCSNITVSFLWRRSLFRGPPSSYYWWQSSIHCHKSQCCLLTKLPAVS